MDDLRARMRSITPPTPALGVVHRRARWIRRRRVGATAIVGLAIVAGVAGPLFLLSPTPPPPEIPAVTPLSDDGVTIGVPRGWFALRDPLGGRLRPDPLVLVGTWPARSVSSCQQDPPDDGALVWIQEYRTGPPARPSRFPPRVPGSFIEVEPYGGFGEAHCVSGESVNGWSYRFRDGGRYFEASIAYPQGTSQRTIDRAYRVLDSLRVDPKPSEACTYWSHPACPEGQWLQLVVQEADGVIEGDTHSAYVVRMGGTRLQFYLWALEYQPPGGPVNPELRLGTVDGVDVYADEIRGWWEANGMVVWFESGPHGEPRPGMKVLERLVRTSLEVPYPPELFEG